MPPRGLFRATGQSTAPIGQTIGTDLGGDFERPEFLMQEENHFYPTPPEPIRAFLASPELARLRQFQSVWEPACGDGALVREMNGVGLDVFSSDLIDRGVEGAHIGSFYDFKEAPSRCMVTNPPFSEAGWGNRKALWLRHALDVLGVEYMALLLNWNWPGPGGLREFWAQHTPARVYLMRWKVDFTGQGSPPMYFAWFVWDAAWAGETVLRVLDKKDGRQGELF